MAWVLIPDTSMLTREVGTGLGLMAIFLNRAEQGPDQARSFLRIDLGPVPGVLFAAGRKSFLSRLLNAGGRTP
jgi:hypothetical protein